VKGPNTLDECGHGNHANYRALGKRKSFRLKGGREGNKSGKDLGERARGKMGERSCLPPILTDGREPWCWKKKNRKKRWYLGGGNWKSFLFAFSDKSGKSEPGNHEVGSLHKKGPSAWRKKQKRKVCVCLRSKCRSHKCRESWGQTRGRSEINILKTLDP